MKSLKKSNDTKPARANTPDLEKEKTDLLATMMLSIPEDLLKQIDYFSKLAKMNEPQLQVWTSSNGTGNAN